MSTKPGVTSLPLASISSAPAPATLPTSTILPPATAMSASKPGAPVPSITTLLRITRSKAVVMAALPGKSDLRIVRPPPPDVNGRLDEPAYPRERLAMPLDRTDEARDRNREAWNAGRYQAWVD